MNQKKFCFDSGQFDIIFDKGQIGVASFSDEPSIPSGPQPTLFTRRRHGGAGGPPSDKRKGVSERPKTALATMRPPRLDGSSGGNGDPAFARKSGGQGGDVVQVVTRDMVRSLIVPSTPQAEVSGPQPLVLSR